MSSCRDWLQGYVRLKVIGNNTERFISLLKSKEIPVRDLEPMQDGYSFFICRKYVRSLDLIRKKTGTKLSVMEKHGLPYLLFRYRKRKFLILGMLLCIAIVYYGSIFVWDIHVNGTAYYTAEEIQRRIEEEYVALGTRKKEIDCDALEDHLREDFPDISWISCELVGTQLNVVVKETLDGTEVIAEDEKPQDLVAAKDGTIVEIITRNGTPVKKRGDTVQKGDVLISGTIYIYDDYDAVLETDHVTADGDVIAETEYTYSDSFELQYYEKNYSGREKTSVLLNIIQLEIPIRMPGKDYLHYDEIRETHTLKLGNAYILPVSLTILKQKEYEPVRKEYSKDEAKKRMEERLERFFNDLHEKGVEIMENHVTISFDDGVCRASGSVVTWERIGYGRVITPAEQ